MALVSNVLTQIFITLIAVAGVYVLTGLTGMFSLGQAAFMAIGAYASGLLVLRLHVPIPLAMLLAVVLAVAVGYLIGYPVVRLRRDYISLVTLGFGEAIAALLNRMTTLTGGASGLTGIPRTVGLGITAVSAAAAGAATASASIRVRNREIHFFITYSPSLFVLYLDAALRRWDYEISARSKNRCPSLAICSFRPWRLSPSRSSNI